MVISVESVVRHKYVDAFRNTQYFAQMISLTNSNQLSFTLSNLNQRYNCYVNKITSLNGFGDRQTHSLGIPTETLTVPSTGRYFLQCLSYGFPQSYTFESDPYLCPY